MTLKLMMLLNKMEIIMILIRLEIICEKFLACNRCSTWGSHYYTSQLTHFVWKPTLFYDWETCFHFSQPSGNMHSPLNARPGHSERI